MCLRGEPSCQVYMYALYYALNSEMNLRKYHPDMHALYCTVDLGVKLREYYSDGTRRPVMRGFLHALVSTSLLTVLLLVLTRVLSAPSWLLSLYFTGKLVSHLSSAAYHLYQNFSHDNELKLLKLDTLMITVAMWAPTNLFVTTLSEWRTLFLFMICATVCNAYIIHLEFDRDYSPFYRVALLLLFGPSQMIVIGWHVDYSATWWLGTFLYLTSSCAAPPMNHYIPSWFTPWHHWKGVWSFHEDFHLLLFLADLIYFGMAPLNALHPLM